MRLLAVLMPAVPHVVVPVTSLMETTPTACDMAVVAPHGLAGVSGSRVKG
jgi:hypothetical protein